MDGIEVIICDTWRHLINIMHSISLKIKISNLDSQNMIKKKAWWIFMKKTISKHIATIRFMNKSNNERILVLPLDTTFIRDLKMSYKNRWLNAGWDLENTVMLEIKYPTIPAYYPPSEGTPSMLFSMLSYIWEEESYFRVLVFSRGYFEITDEQNMKVDVFHEKQHIISYERYLYEGTKPLCENEIAEVERKYVQKTIGEEHRFVHILRALKHMKGKKVIPGIIAMIWVNKYLRDNYKRYSHAAFSLPQNEYYRRILAAERSLFEWARSFYIGTLNIDLFDLI